MTMEKSKTINGRYWYFVDNLRESADSLGHLRLYFSLPMAHTGQKVLSLNIHPEPRVIVEDFPNGNRILVWEKNGFKDSVSEAFYYDFELAYKEVNLKIELEKVLPVNTSSPEYLRYTISEGWLDIDENIRQKAAEITAGETNPYLKAKKIFDWVSGTMSYEYPDVASRGASKSLLSLKGDCAEFSAVFVSLCRASGIPARPVTCNWIKGGGHQWAEVFLSPYGWVPVDPTIANAFKLDPDCERTKKIVDVAGIETRDPEWFFGNLYPDRVMVMLGENIKVRLSGSEPERVFYLLQPGGSVAYPSAAEFSGFSSAPIHGGIYVFGENRADEAYARKMSQAELAESYYQAKMYDQAAAGLEISLKDRPRAAYRWLLLGQVYMAQQKYQKALTALSSSIQGEGGSLKPVWDARAHLYSGNCLDLLGKRDMAVHEYQLALESGVSFENLQERSKEFLAKPYKL